MSPNPYAAPEAVELPPSPVAQPDASPAFSAEGQTLLSQLTARGRNDEPTVLEIPPAFGKPRRESPDYSNVPREGTPETDAPNPPRRWTVAIQLSETVNHENYDGQRIDAGAAVKLRQIQELAEQTRNSPVTLYVQAPLPRESETRQDGTVVTSGRQDVATYRIENGQVTLVDQGPSLGFQQDLQNLIGRAAARAGDGNLGLVIQSHGFAEGGVGGTTGESTLPELEQTIRNGLQASGRTALDLLDFDACSMGNLDVARAMQGEARHVVASAELERAYGNGVDGQNIQRTLSDLIARPDMTPAEVAQHAVELARTGANCDDRSANQCGTETLAHLDLSQFPPVEGAIDGLGTALAAAAADPAQRAVLQQLMNDLPHFENSRNPSGTRFDGERADVGLFLNALDQALASGRLTDSNGAIRQSIDQARQSLQALVPQFHGQPYENYDRMTGMSMFLPGKDTFNIDERSLDASPLGDLISTVSRGKGLTIGNRDHIAEDVESSVTALRAAGVDVSALEANIRTLRAATNSDEVMAAVSAMIPNARAMVDTPAGQAVIAQARQRVLQARGEMFDEQTRNASPNWRAFLNMFR